MASKEHLELSEFIKSVHSDLRLLSKNIGPDQAWLEHCKNLDVLKRYASAMKTLATDHWVKNNENFSESHESRIKWVLSHSKAYFYDECQEGIKKEIDMAAKHEINTENCLLDRVEINDKLKLLDVGSCYNPFKHFDMFSVTAIDLYPATEDVIQCDFLNSDVLDSNTMNNVLVKEYYDIVVFSLFLEYLPSSEQRFYSCLKAYDLLIQSGLLFILTPDSKHATANSKLMKSWRVCLASLGFMRVYYEKKKHLHCMAFKKAVVKDLPLRWFKIKNINNEEAVSMMKIPQDSLSVEPLNKDKEKEPISDPSTVAEYFDILPKEDI